MNTPIGIFDSGLGGLTVVKAFLEHLPGEQLVYFGDTARVPYGTKSKKTITRFSLENTRFLKTHGVKMVIVACHTASSLALESVRQAFEIPILGVVEPGAKKAVEVTQNGKIGVIGTRSTIASASYEKAIKALNPDTHVTSAACPLFVPLVEEGWTEGETVKQVIHHYLEPLKRSNIDTLILGCTHYPILRDRIQEAVSHKIQLVDPAEETAYKAREVLESLELIHRGKVSQNQVQYFVSDEPELFRPLGERFLGQPIESVECVSEDYFEAVL